LSIVTDPGQPAEVRARCVDVLDVEVGRATASSARGDRAKALLDRLNRA
jgi:hypothetical protein